MPPSSWPSKKDYVACAAFPSNALAGEYLARNPQFLKDRKRLDRDAKRNRLTDEDTAAFAADWGILYSDDGNTRWAASVYPGALFLTQPVPGSIIGKPLKLPMSVTDGSCVIGDVSLTLIDRKLGRARPEGPQAYAVLVPLDELIDVRIMAIRHVADQLRGKRAKPFPPKLPVARQDRLVAGLRALDARAQGATYREIGADLHGMEAAVEPSWNSRGLRDRTIRLVREAARLMQGGYRQLLLHPHRSRLPDLD